MFFLIVNVFCLIIIIRLIILKFHLVKKKYILIYNNQVKGNKTFIINNNTNANKSDQVMFAINYPLSPEEVYNLDLSTITSFL